MKHLKYVLSLMLAALAGIVVLLICHHGVGLSSDTMAYFGYPATGNLELLPVHHGILYALILRPFVLAGMSLSAAAVAVNLFCAAAGALIWFFLFLSAPFGKSCAVAFFLAVLVCFSLPMLVAHSYAMSEPLFLLLMAAGISIFIRAVCSNSTGLLFVSAIPLALSCLTRYAGLACVGAACLGIVLFMRTGIYQRIWRSVSYGLLSCIPLAFVLAVNYLRSGSGTNREWVFHGIPADTLSEGASTIASLFLPDRIHIAYPFVAYLLAVLICMGLVTGLAVGIWKKKNVVGILSLFGICYVLFLLVSILFVDVSIMLSPRMLSPLVVVLFPLLFQLLWMCHSAKNTSWIWIALAVYMISFTAYRVIKYTHLAYAEGMGYASTAWGHSPFIRLLEGLHDRHVIYSNAADAMVLRGYPEVIGIPWRQKSTSNRFLGSYAIAYDAMKSDLEFRGAFLAEVRLRYWPSYLVPLQSIVEDCQLIPLVSSHDGVIYASKANPAVQDVVEKTERMNDVYGESVLQICPE